MTSVTATTRSGNQDVDGLLADYRWDPAGGVLRYGFPATSAAWTGYDGEGEPFDNFQALSPAQQNVVAQALGAVSGFTVALTFSGSGSPETAELRFGMTDDTDAAHAYTPYFDEMAGDVWFNNSSGEYDNPVPGNYAYTTFLHEIGHALGLKHPHETDQFGAVSAEHDSLSYTVMSYRAYTGQPLDALYANEDFGFPQTYMMYDIAALQHLYGADFTTRSGDTLYSWNPATGATSIDGVVAIAPGANRVFMTVWDGGGTDTYDFSAYTNGVRADLAPGAWTITAPSQIADVGDNNYAAGNIANALLFQGDTRSLIENATGGSGDDTLNGNEAANHLVGGEGNDYLDGRAGADVLEGGGGADGYVVDDTGDVVVELDGGGGDEVLLTAAVWTISLNVESVRSLSSPFGQSVTGNAQDNYIELRGVAGNYLDGGAGADTMTGGDGDDTYVVDNPGDMVHDAFGNDTIISSITYSLVGSPNDNITLSGTAAINATGNDFVNVLIGNGAANILDGRGGADRLTGGGGNDLYIVDAADLVIEAAGGGMDEVRTALAAYALTAEVENLTGTSASGQTLTGNSLANTLLGGAGNDVLDGAAGADKLKGGNGNDVYILDNAGDAIGDTGGTDEARTTLGSYTLAAGVENLTGLSASGQALHGNSLNNTILGGSGNDTLDGGLSTDQLNGGGGNDIYLVDAADVVTEAAGAGTDEVRTALGSYILAAEVENLTGTSASGQSLTGNALANTLTGGGGNDILNGGVGADKLKGGNGNDVYFLDNAGDAIGDTGGVDEVRTALASYVLAAGIESLTGLSASGQILHGNSLNNVITGGSGNDTLDGGFSTDQLRGGNGNDIYLVDAADLVTEAAGAGTDEVRTALGSYTLTANVETLTGTSASGQALTGNGLANTLLGGAGNDVLDGAAGADKLKGGNGNDVYFIDNAGDAIGETGGTDEARTTLASYTLAAGVENLTGTSATGQILHGNSLNNVITGGAGNDTLDGGFSTDQLRGGSGNDVYIVDAADVVTEAAGAGTDEVRTALGSYTLTASVENLTGTSASGQTLTGNALANMVTASSGNDIIRGGAGGDTLTGGAGADRFVCGSAADSTGLNFDRLVGFDCQADKIDLPTAVSSWASEVTQGRLASANFDSDLASALNNALGPNQAVLFTPDSGDFAGRMFAVVDANGDGAYQSGQDFVFEFVSPAAPIAPVTTYFI